MQLFAAVGGAAERTSRVRGADRVPASEQGVAVRLLTSTAIDVADGHALMTFSPSYYVMVIVFRGGHPIPFKSRW